MPSPNLLAEPGKSLDARVAEAQASVSSPGGIGPVWSRHAELRKASLETAKRQCRVHPVGERLQSCLKFVERAKGTHRKIVEETQQFLTNLESQWAAGLQDSERLRAEARACAVPPGPHTSPRAKPLNCENCAKKWNSCGESGTIGWESPTILSPHEADAKRRFIEPVLRGNVLYVPSCSTACIPDVDCGSESWGGQPSRSFSFALFCSHRDGHRCRG